MAFLLSSRNMVGWPVGVRFCPDGKVLITHYLLPKVRGERIPVDVITECDLYGDKAPWEIYEDKKPREEKPSQKIVEEKEENQPDKLFIFTKVKKGSQNDTVRFAACGAWHLDEESVQEIKDGNTNQVIGLVKEFVFKAKKGDSTTSNDNDDDWIMKEYSLAGSSLVGLSEDPDYVVCELFY